MESFPGGLTQLHLPCFTGTGASEAVLVVRNTSRVSGSCRCCCRVRSCVPTHTICPCGTSGTNIQSEALSGQSDRAWCDTELALPEAQLCVPALPVGGEKSGVGLPGRSSAHSCREAGVVQVPSALSRAGHRCPGVPCHSSMAQTSRSLPASLLLGFAHFGRESVLLGAPQCVSLLHFLQKGIRLRLARGLPSLPLGAGMWFLGHAGVPFRQSSSASSCGTAPWQHRIRGLNRISAGRNSAEFSDWDRAAAPD